MRILNDVRWSRCASYAVGLAVLLAVTLLHVLVLHKHGFADDLYFSAALDQKNLWEFLAFRYSRWTGRIPIEFMLVLVVNHVWLWKLLNILMFMLLTYSMAVLASGARRATGFGLALVACLVLLVHPDVIWWAAWWLTGSVNYLWPAALGAFALTVYFRSNAAGPWQVTAALVCGGLAAYSEQVAIMLLALVSISLAWRSSHGTAKSWHYIFALAIAISTAVALTAPGNANRFEAEQATWFPDFSALGFDDKLNIGLGLVSRIVLAPENWLMLLASFVALLALIRSSVPVLLRWSLLPGLLWIAGCHLLVIVGYEPVWLRGFPLGAASASRPIAYAVMAVSVYSFACLVSVAGIASTSRTSLREPMLALALLTGAGTLLLLGWSPTSTASGSRTAFVFMMASVVVVADLLSRLRQGPSQGLRSIYWVICAAIVICALIRMRGLFVGA
ncbi:MAG: hypothetical protein KY442_04365 [Proteobacteria bacterium]|nr:hypothetical protein [Pseudomonadota bacterium]